MTKPIGPTFIAELKAAVPTSLLGLAFSWDAAGNFTYEPSMTTDQIAAVVAVYTAHDPTRLTPQMIFDALIAGGLAITSTATPALDGTFPIDDAARANIDGVIASLNAGKGFPLGLTLLPVYDMASPAAAHNFAETDYVNLAEAVRDFYARCLIALQTALAGGSPTWPTPAATIA